MRTTVIAAALAAGIWSACTGSPGTEVNAPPPPAPSLAVTAVAPIIGHPGENLDVTIYGSNLQSGATVSWDRNGVAEPKVQVVSVRVSGSSTLLVTLNIAADAPTGYYDIAVSRPGSPKASLAAQFELTEGYPVSGTSYAFAVNDAGTIVGRWNEDQHLGFVWTPGGGRSDLPTDRGNIDTNGAQAIDEAGVTIAGVSGNEAAVWTQEGAVWMRTNLARDTASGYALAHALASDPSTGRATIIAGAEGYGMDGLTPNGNPQDNQRPIAWVQAGGAWQRSVLPTPPGTLHGTARAASASGRVAGYVSANGINAAVWTPDGNGSWALELLVPARSAVVAINSAGDLAVGVVNVLQVNRQPTGTPAYWVRTGSAWSIAKPLPPTPQCSGVSGVDDSGRILGNPCRPDGRRWVPVVWRPPYDEQSIRLFAGLGNKEMGGHPFAMSQSGKWIVGGSNLGTSPFTGAYWRAF